MASSSTASRISPGGKEEVGLLNWVIVRLIGAVTGGGPPRIFTTLGRNRGLFRRWLVFAGGLMPGGKLPRAETELVILRVAHNCGCEYEWSHHERLAATAGLDAEQIERARRGPDADGWSERQADLLRAADELHGAGRIGDGLWARLASRYDEGELIELCLLVGHYEMLAMTLNSIGVQPDPVPIDGVPRGRLSSLALKAVTRGAPLR